MIDWIKQNPDLLMVSATVTLCVITAYYAHLTRQILEDQRKPNVIVAVVPDEQHPQLMNFEIANYGLGVATQLKFRLSGEFPQGHSENWEDFLNNSPFKLGIDALTPGQKITFLWGEFQSLLPSLRERRLSIGCCYRSASGRSYKGSHPISISHYSLTYTRTPPIQVANNHLKVIADSLKRTAPQHH